MGRYFFIVLVVLITNPVKIWSQQSIPSKDVEGVTITTIKSNALNENREIYIYVPNRNSSGSYPVLYLLDGHRSEALKTVISHTKIKPHIIVGISSKVNRTRDLIPFVMDSRPGSGESDSFIEFLSDELQPYINDTYSTNGRNILFGASAGGLFSLYCLFMKPGLFDNYISLSPPVGYDIGFMNNLIIKTSELNINRLYISAGNRGEMPQVTKYLSDYSQKLQDKFPDVEIKYEIFENEAHVPMSSVTNSINFVINE